MNRIRRTPSENDAAPGGSIPPHSPCDARPAGSGRGGDPRRRARVRPQALVAVLLLAMTMVASLAAAEPFAYDLSAELMSPFCPGRTLASCPSPQAAELIQWMVVQEAGGATREQVIASLIEDYGEEILGAPPAEGVGFWAYGFPVFAFVAGGVIAVFVLRRIVVGGAAGNETALAGAGASDVPDASDAGAEGSAAAPSEDDDLARIVDSELAFRD